MDFRKKSETVKAYRIGDAPVPSWVGELFINHRFQKIENVDGHFRGWSFDKTCVDEGEWLIMFSDGTLGQRKEKQFAEEFEPVDEHARIA
jgi:hypothetical protein